MSKTLAQNAPSSILARPSWATRDQTSFLPSKPLKELRVSRLGELLVRREKLVFKPYS